MPEPGAGEGWERNGPIWQRFAGERPPEGVGFVIISDEWETRDGVECRTILEWQIIGPMGVG